MTYFLFGRVQKKNSKISLMESIKKIQFNVIKNIQNQK